MLKRLPFGLAAQCGHFLTFLENKPIPNDTHPEV
jgi:hypothetical protein